METSLNPTFSGKKNQISQYLYISKDMAYKLKAEADRNSAFKAVCEIFATRERSRKQVTLRTLHLTMLKRGYNFPKGEYARCLRFLGALGIGKLYIDNKGRLNALKSINVALQTIAIAALSPVEDTPAPKPKMPRTTAKLHIEKPQLASVTILVGGRAMEVQMPVDAAIRYLFMVLADKQPVTQ